MECSEDSSDPDPLDRFEPLREKIASIKETGFEFSFDELSSFITRAIPAREQLKFEFTKNIDSALTLIRKLGKFLTSATSITSVEVLMSESRKTPILGRELRMRISHYRKKQIVYDLTRLPGMIVDADCIHCFEIPESQPNFITEGCVRAPVQPISARKESHELQKIALIENADPGFDRFSEPGLSGLLPNTAEQLRTWQSDRRNFNFLQQLDADSYLEQVAGAEFVELDCKGRQIRKIR